MSQKILIRVVLPLSFLVFFVIGLYLTFPGRAINGSVASYMETSLFSKTDPRMTEPAEVTIEKVSLWRLSGLELENVKIKEPGSPQKPGAVWEIENLRVRVGFWSLLFGGKRIEFKSDLYDAYAGGAFVLTKENQMSAVELEVQDLDLKKVPAIARKIGLPVSGVVAVDAYLDFGKNPSEDGEGYLDFAIDRMEILGAKPGKVNINFSFAKGEGKSKPVKISGGDVEAEAEISLQLTRDILRSRLSGDGWFKFNAEFAKKNSILLKQIASHQDANGKYAFRLYGTLDAPIPSWGALRTRNFDKNNPLRSFQQ